MTEPNIGSAPDAGAESRPNGVDGSHGPIDSGSTPDPNASSGNGAADPNRRDYIARLKSEPDFAVEEYRKVQSRATKIAEELNGLRGKLGSLTGLLDQGISGDVVAAAVEEYKALASDPQIQQALQHYRQTGELRLSPSPASQQQSASESTAVEDEYLTDTERALRSEVTELREQLSNIQNSLTEHTRNTGVSALTQHLQDAFTRYGLDGDRATQARDALLKQVESWQAQGEVGRRALADLQHPTKGKETVELMLSKTLGMDGLLEIAREKVLREGNTRAGMATDVPSAFGTTGDEPAPEHKSIADAIKAARARPEVLANY